MIFDFSPAVNWRQVHKDRVSWYRKRYREDPRNFLDITIGLDVFNCFYYISDGKLVCFQEKFHQCNLEILAGFLRDVFPEGVPRDVAETVINEAKRHMTK